MPKMRLGWYAVASTALAGAVVLSAFQQRPNFYSAMVYLAQSNFCLIILVNFTLLLYSTFIFGLTRLCFGRLRAIETEVLTERAWFAITETCLAMTIFRDEIGAWFLVMFTALITGKVWGWIGDGRVEILEQQPPANPRLFHTRLSVSLALSFLFDVLILRYTVRAVIQKARPNMMVMFLFEFAVLTTASWRSALRYLLSVAEQRIIKTQTKQRLEERRQEVREQRQRMITERERAVDGGEPLPENQDPLPDENDIEEMDIEVPGWAEKGEWVLWLDLFTDMLKLAIYVAFFLMLLVFYGQPIHIIRDLFMTTRDFLKRLRALLRYRKAIKEMDRFPEATEENLSRENTCIICREEMRPWDPASNPRAVDRVRPKKLPCGHILHLGCLKSWLERQQVCPTCRTPVTGTPPRAQANRDGALHIQVGGQGQPPQNPAGQPNNNGNGNDNPQGLRQGQEQQPQQQQQRNGPRIFNFGPFRLGLADNQQQFNQLLHGGAPGQDVGNNAQTQEAPAQPATQQPAQTDELARASALLEQSIQAINREYNSLSNTTQQIQTVQLLLAELHRLRQQQQRPHGEQTPSSTLPPAPTAVPVANLHPSFGAGFQMNPNPNLALNPNPNFALPGRDQAPMPLYPAFPHYPMLPYTGQPPPRISSPIMGSRHGSSGYSIPAGSTELPEGVVIPPGWNLMPLQRLEGGNNIPPQPFPQFPAGGSTQTHLSTQPPGLGSINVVRGAGPPPSEPTSLEAVPMSEYPRSRPTEATRTTSNISEPPLSAVSTSAVPNWSGSAQFLAQATPTTQASIPSVRAPSDRPPPPNPLNREDSSSEADSSSVAESSEEDEEPAPQPKGKARAVTVEEASSEEESD